MTGMTIRRARASLRDVLWEGDTVAATLFIGRKKGKQPRNRTGFCAKRPAEFKQRDLDETVKGIRSLILIERGLTPTQAKNAIGGSRVAQRGWYRGDAEASAAYTIFFDPSVKGEETPERFKHSMQRLAEYVGGSLCQDEVIVQFTSPTGNRSMGVRDDATQRRQVALLYRERPRR